MEHLKIESGHINLQITENNKGSLSTLASSNCAHSLDTSGIGLLNKSQFDAEEYEDYKKENSNKKKQIKKVFFEEAFIELVFIESYKVYNRQNTYIAKKTKNCKCLIF